MKKMLDLKNAEENKISKALENKIISLRKGMKLEDAISLCKTAIESDPTNAKWHIYLGDIYVQKHRDIYNIRQFIDEAITEYQRALESNINPAIAHYKIAYALYLKGDLDKSLNQVNIAIKHKQDYSEAYYLKGRILAKKDALQESYENLLESIKYGKCSNARAHYLAYLTRSLLYSKNFFCYPPHIPLKKWYHLLAAVLQLPFDGEARKAVAERLSALINFYPTFVKGAYFEKVGAIDAAIELYSEKLEEAPGFLDFYIALGNAYKSIGKYEEAINEYRMAIWHYPLHILAHKSLCALYEETAEYDKAVDAYKKLIELQPRFPILYSNLATILYTKGDIDEAIKYYQMAINLNPSKDWTSVVAQMLAHIQHEAKQNFDAAISAYQSAQQLNPNDMETYINLGSVFYDKGDYSNSQMIYRLALEIDPCNARLHCNLAYLLWGKGEIDEAMKEYKLAIQYDPNYDIAHNNLGVLYLDDLGKVKEAIDCLEDAIKANPNYALGYYNLGRAMVVCGDKMEAARLYQIALDINKITNEIDPVEIQDRLNNLFE